MIVLTFILPASASPVSGTLIQTRSSGVEVLPPIAPIKKTFWTASSNTLESQKNTLGSELERRRLLLFRSIWTEKQNGMRRFFSPENYGKSLSLYNRA